MWDISPLGLCCGRGPMPLIFFSCMETWEQGKKTGPTSVSPATGVGRQPGRASAPGAWKQFQVLYFRQHNRSVMYFCPQVSEHHVCTNSGWNTSRLSIHLCKKTARGRAAEDQTAPVTARCHLSNTLLTWLRALSLPGRTRHCCHTAPAVPAL